MAGDRPAEINFVGQRQILKTYEVEQKYRVKNPAAFRRKIIALKARKISSGFEENAVYNLRKFGIREGILRLRRSGKKAKLTLKGPRLAGRFKKRVEIETEVDFTAMNLIFRALKWKPSCRYSKVREEYQKGSALIVLDFLKGHGWFAEIEAPARQIHLLERKLGLKISDREHRTYLQILGLRYR